MKRDSEVGTREASEEPVFQHGGGAANTLFGGLSDKDESSMPAIFVLRKESCSADADGHVQVVPAGVHDRNVGPLIVFGHDVTRIRQAGLFRDGQRVEFRSNHHCRSITILENAYHSRATDSGGDLETKLAQMVRHGLGGLHLVQRKLRVAMQVHVEGFDLGIDAIDLVF